MEMVDLGSIMLPRAAWKRIETHFDIRKDFFHGSGNCLCTLLNHVSCAVGLDPTALCPQFRAKSKVAGTSANTSLVGTRRHRSPSSPRLSSVLDNRICGHAIRINVHRKTCLSHFSKNVRLGSNPQFGRWTSTGLGDL